jgi:cellulase (glycosyl hydrolase family 5)
MCRVLLLFCSISVFSTSAFASNPQVGLVVAGLVDAKLSDQQVQSALQQAKQAGAQFVREVFYWDQMQPTGPSFDPAYLAAAERFVQKAINVGLTPYITLENSPPWARHCTADGTADCDPAYPPASDMWIWWRNFVSDVVNHFPQVTYWGVWNEPNDVGFLKISPSYRDWFDEYYLLFAYAADAIQAAAGRVIAGPELSSGVSSRNLTPEAEFQNFVNALGYRLRPQDILTVHFYGSWPYSAWDLEHRMLSYNSSAAGAGLSNQIWLTEAGWGVWETDDIDQALVLTRIYRKLLSTSASRWTKVFKFHLWAPIENLQIVTNALSANPTFRPAYLCLQALANGWPLPELCNCIPDGRRDDTLYETDCCSGYAVPGSTECTNPADYNTTWESCSQLCATAP